MTISIQLSVTSPLSEVSSSDPHLMYIKEYREVDGPNMRHEVVPTIDQMISISNSGASSETTIRRKNVGLMHRIDDMISIMDRRDLFFEEKFLSG